MTHDFKPCDVALVDGCVAMAWVEDGETRPSWVYTDADGDACSVWMDATDARPLLVIDVEDAEQVATLRVAYYDAMRSLPQGSPTLNQDAMQAALRSLVAPPKPDEPCNWLAVIEDADGRKWYRDGQGLKSGRHWYTNREPDTSPDDRQAYADIAAVRVLSEGVAL